MKKLLIATDNFLPRWDGIARFLSTTLPGLLDHYEITIIAPDFGHHEHPRYHLVQLPVRKKAYGDLHLATFRYHIISREIKQTDIVFTQTIGPIGALSIIAAKRHDKPLVSFIHSMETDLVPMAVAPTPLRSFLYTFMRWFTTFLYQKSDLLLTPSESVDDQLSWQGITTRKKVIRLGVDTKLFCPGPSKTLRKTLGIDEKDIVIGQHGRLAREKDVTTLLRAFLRLQKKYPHIKLLVIAEGLPSIRRMFKDREGVILKESQNDIAPYLRVMDIFVMTSLTETTCLSALEAMSTGLAVVSTPVGFVKDYITDGKNGLFFPFKDTYALSERLSWLIDHPTLAKNMGQEARKLVEKEFTWEKTVENILESLAEF